MKNYQNESIDIPNNEDGTLAEKIYKLPGQLKDVAVLCWCMGLDYAETAKTLKIPRFIVCRQMKKARYYVFSDFHDTVVPSLELERERIKKVMDSSVKISEDPWMSHRVISRATQDSQNGKIRIISVLSLFLGFLLLTIVYILTHLY